MSPGPHSPRRLGRLCPGRVSSPGNSRMTSEGQLQFYRSYKQKGTVLGPNYFPEKG